MIGNAYKLGNKISIIITHICIKINVIMEIN